MPGGVGGDQPVRAAPYPDPRDLMQIEVMFWLSLYLLRV